MLKIIGFLSILTVSIASLGLVGIVLFTTASRTKEIGVRKVMGSSIGDLVYLLSKEFMLLFIAPVILALPAAFFFFDRVVVSEYAYHAPVSIADLSTSLFIVLSIALPVIGIQAWRIARANPIQALRND
jgi:putative ABC transport system permease protein